MRPSTGCITCVKRKIKCDEVKPVCQRCIKSKRECAGYRVPKRHTFLGLQPVHDDLAVTATNYDTNDREFAWEQYGLDSSSGLHLSPMQSQSLELKALCCFFEDFAWTPKSYTFSLDYLPRVYTNASTESGLAKVARAVSLAYLGHRTRDHSLEVLARKEYGAALTAVNRCLGTTTTPVNDQMMMTLHLLILFENITVTEAAPDKFLTSWMTHLSGSSLAVSQRGLAQLNTDVGRAMFRLQIVKMIIYSMLKGESLPKFAEDWLRNMAPDANEIGVDLLHTVRRCASMFQRAKILLQSIASADPFSGDGFLLSQQYSELSELVTAMVELDSEFEVLLESVEPTRGHYSEEYAWVTSNLGIFYACRLIHNRVLQICASKLHLTTGQSAFAAMDSVEAQRILERAKYVQSETVSAILRIVPEAMGLKTRYPVPPVASSPSPLSAFLNLWPVFVTLHATREATEQQRTWLVAVLMHFAYNDGIWIAQTFATQPFAALDQLAITAGV